jgi:hypothetical protein
MSNDERDGIMRQAAQEYLTPEHVGKLANKSRWRAVNRTRRHSHLGGVSPKAFETAAA